jgi:hypothetical protein
MTTSNENVPKSAPEGNEENTMESTNSSTFNDFLDRLDRWVKGGWLSKEGKQRLLRSLEAAQHIDPETADVKWEYTPFLDRYAEFRVSSKMARQYFARSPGSDIWVSWGNLPEQTELSLWEKHKETDPALCEPTSCWAAFVHSQYFRRDQDEKQNFFRYLNIGALDNSQNKQ